MAMSVEPADDRGRVLATVSAVLAKVLGRALPSLADETALIDDLGLDSTQVLELLMDLEEKLGVEFDFDVLEQDDIETLGSITNFALAAVAPSLTHNAETAPV